MPVHGVVSRRLTFYFIISILILNMFLNRTGSIAAQRLSIGSYLFSRVTGSIFIQNIENEEKLNVGLGLKFTKQGDEVNLYYYLFDFIGICTC